MRDSFNCDITGKCGQFQTVPGCGLRCTVSYTENMMAQILGSEQIINFQNSLKYDFFDSLRSDAFEG